MWKAICFVTAWFHYFVGYGLHNIANIFVDLSMKAQGIYGFKHWPWSEDDLWTNGKHPDKSVSTGDSSSENKS